MFYNFDLTIPANTPTSAQSSRECVLSYGRIEKVDILFPPGPCGLAGVAVDRFNTQILPSNPDSFFISDSETVSSIDAVEIYDRPYVVVFRGYNLDDTYTHTITLRVSLNTESETLRTEDVSSLSRSLQSQLI